MTTQSIIVYRNPAEAAFWESGMVIPLGGAMIVGFLSFLVVIFISNKLSGTSYRRHRRGKIIDWTAALASFALSVFTFNYLMI